MRGECAAAGSPQEPDFEFYDQFPLTSNDAASNEKVTKAFEEHFADGQVYQADPATASEDFSTIPDAFGVPYTYWTVGCADPDAYRAAVAEGTVASKVPANHSSFFAPAIRSDPGNRNPRPGGGRLGLSGPRGTELGRTVMSTARGAGGK